LSTRARPFITAPHLLGLLVVTARLVQEQAATRLSALGISYAQAVVLVRLYRSVTGRLSQTDMIESLAVSRASGTLVLSQLEARGLVARSTDPDDARRQVISLTEAGWGLEQPVYAVLDEVETVIRRSIDSHEVAAAFDILRRMFDNIKRHRSTRT
jgi:DNA-binding MarR family transcriptional regulator